MARGLRFLVRAAPSAQTLSRVIDLFAQRDLMASSVCARHEDDMLLVTIDILDLPEAQANIIAEKLRSSVLVDAVELTRRRTRRARRRDDKLGETASC